MNVHPAYLEPRRIGYRPGKLPDVFCISCRGPMDDTPVEMMGRTSTYPQRCTVYRYASETDEALQSRVDAVVKSFKAKYGWNQRVSVIYDYEASAAHGELWQSWDELINLEAWAAYAKQRLPRREDKEIALVALHEIRCEKQRVGVGCVPPGLH